MRQAGRATPEGTAAYAKRLEGRVAAGHFHDADGVSWSSIGLGTYLGKPDDATDALVESAVEKALAAGVNVIDTAINYRFERAEKSIGRALARASGKHAIKREEFVVCTKGGYLPHPTRGEWFQSHYVGQGGISKEDLVADSHCMHPVYLLGELDRSRVNLGIDTLDVYYIHNPEAQVGAVDADTFRHRLREAFGVLESAADEGRIGAYGIASWNAFRVKPGEKGYISLVEAKTLARQAAGGGEDRFKYIQLPFNVAMREAHATPTQKVGDRMLPAIQAAISLGLRPVLSGAIAQARFGKLPPTIAERLGADLPGDGARALQFARSVPGALTALVGMKQPPHVAENLSLTQVPPLDAETFAKLLSR